MDIEEFLNQLVFEEEQEIDIPTLVEDINEIRYQLQVDLYRHLTSGEEDYKALAALTLRMVDLVEMTELAFNESIRLNPIEGCSPIEDSEDDQGVFSE